MNELAGWAARLMDSLGEWGVGLFTLLETVFPPVLSEIILPLAGYLAQLNGRDMFSRPGDRSQFGWADHTDRFLITLGVVIKVGRVRGQSTV